MKKILFSTTSFDHIDNGPALFANLAYKNFHNNKEFDVRILTEDVCDHKLDDRIYKVKLKKNRFNESFYQFIRIFYYHREAKIISKIFNYDILVYNNAFTGFLSALFFKKKVVVMINDDNNMTHKYKKNNYKLYVKFQILRWLEKVTAKKSFKVIVNSNFLRDALVKEYKIPKNKIFKLYKGIPLSDYTYRERLEMKKPVEVLFVKADFIRGGLLEVIEAISLIKEIEFRLIIIGPQLKFKPFILDSLKEKKIDNYVFLGPQSPKTVKQYLNSTDIFCVPSKKEALGVANMEALASGLPVISTNIGGIPEVLNNGKCGWIIRPNDPLVLSEAIKECIFNNELRIKKSIEGHKFIQKFDSRHLINNFSKLLDKCL